MTAEHTAAAREHPDLSTLPPLRAAIAAQRLSARRALGQNFLLDLNLTRRIARAAAPEGAPEGETVIEIGAGPGGLTRALLETGARVVAVERDRRCIAALAALTQAAPGRLRVVEADARKVDLRDLAPAPRRVVGNLPYNVGTRLLAGWLDRLARAPDYAAGFTLMFQKEVAQRLAAAPGTPAWGRLGVLAQWLCMPSVLFDVPARAFTPPPRVTSSLVRLVPRARPLAPADPDRLRRVTAAAFGQRRKMLRSSLKALGVDAAALLAAAGIDGRARAGTLDVAGFCRLAEALSRIEDGPRTGSSPDSARGAGAPPSGSPSLPPPRARSGR